MSFPHELTFDPQALNYTLAPHVDRLWLFVCEGDTGEDYGALVVWLNCGQDKPRKKVGVWNGYLKIM